MNLLTFAGAWASIVGGVIAIFTLGERVSTNQTKAGISLWLQSEQSNQPFDRWPNHFISLFDSVFGKSHFRPRCIMASLLASVFGAFSIGLLLSSIYPDSGQKVVEILTDGPRGLVLSSILTVIMLNAIPDYVSLLESRYLLGLLANNPTRLRIGVILIADVFITALIWVSLCLFFGSLFDWIFFDSNSWLDSMRNLGRFMKDSIGSNDKLGLLFKITFFSTFFTSFWLWAYLGAGLLIRFLNMASRGKARVFGLLETNKAPILSLGFISCLLITAVFLIVAPYTVGHTEQSPNKKLQPTAESGG